MLSFIEKALIINPDEKQINDTQKGVFLFEDADNPKYNKLKQKLKPMLLINHIDQEQASEEHNILRAKKSWIGSNFDFLELLPKEPKNNFKIISYHTPDALYKESARRLKESLEKLNIEFIIEERSSLGNWEANCAQKSLFIKEQWQKSDKPVVWIDSDAVLKQYPYLFDYMDDVDFAIHKNDHWEFLSGGVYFGKQPVVLELLNLWVKLCKKDPHILDQLQLDFAWHQLQKNHHLTTLWLPRQYTKIFDKESSSPPVIEHFQASRSLNEIELKKKVPYRKLRKNQRYYRKMDLTPPPISLGDKFLDLFNKLGL